MGKKVRTENNWSQLKILQIFFIFLFFALMFVQNLEVSTGGKRATGRRRVDAAEQS